MPPKQIADGVDGLLNQCMRASLECACACACGLQVIDELQAREARLQQQIKAKQQELLLQVGTATICVPEALPHAAYVLLMPCGPEWEGQVSTGGSVAVTTWSTTFAAYMHRLCLPRSLPRTHVHHGCVRRQTPQSLHCLAGQRSH